MNAKPRTRLKALELDAISLVDAGDNPHADVLLLKRRPDMTATRKEAPQTTAQVLAVRELNGEMWDAVEAWQSSLWSILNAEIDPAEKVRLITQSLDEFVAAIKRVLGGGEAAPPAAEIAAPEAMDMSGVLATAKAASAHVEQVRKWMEARKMPKIEDPAVAKLDLTAIPEAQRPAVEALSKRAEENAAQLAELAKARDAEKTRADALDAELAKVAPDPYRGMPAEQAAALRKRDERIAKLEAANEEQAAILKARADGLGAVPGITTEKLAPMLLRVRKALGDETADEFTRLLKAGAEAQRLAGITRELTAGGEPADDTPMGESMKRAGAVRKANPAMTEEQALAAVWGADPALAAKVRTAQARGN